MQDLKHQQQFIGSSYQPADIVCDACGRQSVFRCRRTSNSCVAKRYLASANMFSGFPFFGLQRLRFKIIKQDGWHPLSRLRQLSEQWMLGQGQWMERCSVHASVRPQHHSIVRLRPASVRLRHHSIVRLGHRLGKAYHFRLQHRLGKSFGCKSCTVGSWRCDLNCAGLSRGCSGEQSRGCWEHADETKRFGFRL